METAELTPTSTFNLKSQKRSSNERDLEDNNVLKINEEIIPRKHFSKRFKSLDTFKINKKLELKMYSDGMDEFNKNEGKNYTREVAESILSPISEISTNLSEAYLNSETDDNIPFKKRKENKITNFYIFNTDIYDKNKKIDIHGTQAFIKGQKAGTESSQINEYSRNEVFLPCPDSMKTNTSLDEMAVEDLSLYDDDTPSQSNSYVTNSPQLIRLLSPEGSPQRFQFVDNSMSSSCAARLVRDHKLQNTPLNLDNTMKDFRMFHSLSSSCSKESSIDDDYMEFFEMESLDEQNDETNLKLPRNLHSLISGKIKTSSPSVLITEKTPRRPSVRRCLSMTERNLEQQPRTPELLKEIRESATKTPPMYMGESFKSTTPLTTHCFKRPDPPSTTCSPIHNKRCRGNGKENLDSPYSTVSNAVTNSVWRPPLRKCISMNDTEIMLALARSECTDEPVLIGDFSKPFALPLMEGRHRDLKSVSSDTVARLIKGEFNEKVANYKIIDCRYPYEYEGGHILGAVNLYTQEQIVEEFLTKKKTDKQNEQKNITGNKRNIVIFHCEFSSERGPKLSRFLRNNDRARNTNAYPALDYPEIYLLHNGYKEFYETHSELCDPTDYRPMLEPSYNAAYKHFRSKSKSWNGDGLNAGSARLKKSRSRLIL